MRSPPVRTLVLAVLTLAAAGAQAAGLTRGPFLQQVGPTRAVIVLRTDVAIAARIRFGTAPGTLSAAVTETLSVTDHIVELTGLTPGTRYFYAVDLGTLPAATGAGLQFRTAPALDSATPFRFFVIGDTGTGDAHQQAVAQRMLEEVAPPAFVLHLGDLAYPTSDAAALEARFFSAYAPLIAQSAVWPVVGESEAAVPDAGAFRDAFVLPGNELSYSFDYGNAHLLALDTEVEPFNAGSAQLTFAQSDLAGSARAWKFAFFHRPPFSGGTSSGDPAVQASIDPVLENNFVDLVFSGHSHVEERTQLLQNAVVVQASGDGGYDKSGAPNWTMYLVSGVGGQRGGLLDAGVAQMAFQTGNVNGLEVIDVAGPVLHGYFLEEGGAVRDLFTLRKGADTQGPVPLAARAGPDPTVLRVQFNEPVQAGSGPGGAEAPGNYTVAPSLAVTQAVLGADLRTVSLTTGPHAPGNYTLTVSNVLDRAPTPNAVATGSTVAYSFAPADGGTDAGGAGGSDGGADGGSDGGSDGGTTGGSGNIPGGGIGGTPATGSGCTGCGSSALALGLVLAFRARRR